MKKVRKKIDGSSHTCVQDFSIISSISQRHQIEM